MPQWGWNFITVLVSIIGAGVGAYIGVSVKLARVETQIAFMLKQLENLEKRVHRLANRMQAVVNRLTILEYKAGINPHKEPGDDELDFE